MAWSKESSHARGYGAQWRKLRLFILERDHYLCQCDQCKGGELRLTPATEVNHKTSKAEAKRLGWTQAQIDAEANLEAINTACHDRITKLQKGHRPKRTVGADGWPV